MRLNDGLERLRGHTSVDNETDRIRPLSGLKRIEEQTFCWCRRLKSVSIPSGVEHIGRLCFWGSGIEKISIPCSLVEIGEKAFWFCYSLQTVWVEAGCVTEVEKHVDSSVKVLSGSQTMVGGQRLWDLRRLRNVVVPDGIGNIGKEWFWGSDIESVTIPASVAKIEDGAFEYCKSLKEVVFAEGSRLTEIGESVFANCWRLEKINFPKGLKSIAQNAFFHCSSLKSVRLPTTFEKIGVRCFWDSGIKEIALPSTLKEIGESAFGGRSSLRIVFVEDGFPPEFRNLLRSSVKIISRQTRIGDRLLYDMRALREIVVPSSVQKIENHWFEGSDIENAYIPASVTSLGIKAFCDCRKLRRVTFEENSQLKRIEA